MGDPGRRGACPVALSAAFTQSLHREPSARFEERHHHAQAQSSRRRGLRVSGEGGGGEPIPAPAQSRSASSGQRGRAQGLQPIFRCHSLAERWSNRPGPPLIGRHASRWGVEDQSPASLRRESGRLAAVGWGSSLFFGHGLREADRGGDLHRARQHRGRQVL